MEAFTLEFVVIIGMTVISVTLITAFVGKLVGIYPVEASISAGLGMMNMGGTGDVSVLAAAKRMELMAFCQIASTLGASLILDRKSTRLNSSHVAISYAVFCLKK